jgi:phosphoglycerol transferase MdoB-like AlkP superfamily enzyme
MPRFLGVRASGRIRLLFVLWVGLLFIDAVLRMALLLRDDASIQLVAAGGALARGVLIDSAAIAIALAPVCLAIAFGRGRLIARPRLRQVFLGSLFSAAIFLSFVEYFFFEEFQARFNHIALDYLIYPDEVAGNIWESYSVPAFVAAALVCGALIAWIADRFVRGGQFPARRWTARMSAAALSLAVTGLCLVSLSRTSREYSGDRRMDEIGTNGLLELVRAFRTAGLSYSDYYVTVPQQALDSAVLQDMGTAAPGDPAREFSAVEHREKPPDVVVILGESFGSEFVGSLGGDRPCTPGFDRWASEGLLLTNVVATGNRTVRGLEGVLCSFVPLPGDSIWKRDKSDDVASIAGVLGQRGYRTEFLYGGAGAFDGMRSFALRNGWQSFIEDGLIGASHYPDDAYRTAWGVADEYLFTELLARQRAAKRDGVPYFATALTTSNHKPYLTPDTRPAVASQERFIVWALGLALAGYFSWRFFAHSIGRARLATAIGVVSVVTMVLVWSNSRPHGTREGAVRYADRALAEYLDAAKAEGLLDHTIVLFVGDHGARVYGAAEIPAESYRVPALLLAPESKYHGAKIERLCSQVDLAPTLLSLAGIDHYSPFFGSDLLSLPPDGPGRAWLIHNRDIGLLTDRLLIVLGLRHTWSAYMRDDRDSDEFVRVEPGAGGGCERSMVDRAAAVFQLASTLYEGHRYRLLDAP